MKLKSKFDIFTVLLVLLFFLVLASSFFINGYVYKKTEQLTNATREINFLVSLKTSLTQLEHYLWAYLADPVKEKRKQVKESMDRFYSLVGRTTDFKLNEDELRMIRYLRRNIERFSSLVNRILYSSEKGKAGVLFQGLRSELFEQVGKQIDEHWSEDVVKVDRASAAYYRAKKRMISFFVAAFVALVLAVISIRTTISRGIIKPISKISHSSRLMAKGALNNDIRISSNDELGELAGNFNSMAASLREKIGGLESSYQRGQRVVRELAILNEFIGYVSSETEFETVLHRFVGITSDLMKADLCSILVFPEDGSSLFICNEDIITEESIERLLLKRNEGPGSVLEKQKAIIYNAQEDGALSVDGIRNALVLPLISTIGLSAVLTVMNKNGGFDYDDEDSLFGFAFQAFQTIAFQNELARLAVTDGLTGLYNHRIFQERLAAEIRRAGRYKRKLFLVMLDIDYFKRFNDTYGHQAGDEVLRRIASTIKDNIRAVDFAARYGGEEFVIILPETDCDRAYKVAERIRQALENSPFQITDSSRVNITISMGISCFPHDTTDKEDLIKKADTALYFAKQNGRNRAVLYREMPVAEG
ncbi:response regulator PleD [bacterium BMS3Bbin06]|nr:response regulator PleD [bacterium BMS3Bbin06]